MRGAANESYLRYGVLLSSLREMPHNDKETICSLVAYAQSQHQSIVTRDPHQFRVKIGPILFLTISLTSTGSRITAYCTDCPLQVGNGGRNYTYKQRLAGKGKFKECHGVEWNLSKANAVVQGKFIINTLIHEYGSSEARVKICKLVN
jgi:hypothetical protein